MFHLLHYFFHLVTIIKKTLKIFQHFLSRVSVIMCLQYVWYSSINFLTFPVRHLKIQQTWLQIWSVDDEKIQKLFFIKLVKSMCSSERECVSLSYTFFPQYLFVLVTKSYVNKKNVSEENHIGADKKRKINFRMQNAIRVIQWIYSEQIFWINEKLCVVRLSSM